MTNTVIQLTQFGKPEEAFSYTELTIPGPQHDEVQIAVERFGINYADVMAREGNYKETPPLPCVLGYEVVGEVTKIGKDCPKALLGKRVVAFTRFGGYSQCVNTKHVAVAEIGDYDGNKALCLATQYVTAFYMSHVATTIQKGDNVLIHAAAGGVGTALIQILKHKGVNIIAKTGSDSKTPYLKALGVNHIVNYNKSDYAEQVKGILKDEILHTSFNPVAGSTFKKDFKLLGLTGTLVLFGGSERSGKKWGILSTLNFVRKMGIVIPIGLMMQAKSIIGINMLKVGDLKPLTLQYCLEEVVRMARNGEVEPQVSAVYSAKEISEAHAFLASGKSTGKVVLEW
ncbi:quinone oxidoreductase family protein [Brumimicrobium aurantiacum]|uniref:Alcohol dehydrogenase n=1 Tax=Brumimicrobium aurantiacum TaxID=1737063 RepID=A0A3E1F249_9FLAO|nr:zinc-binding dehydrogenase [Brumimicrobium aurantiacum]RFC55898.1 alcohol dehydrogenase [Brumimicrobium aurantiacum]